MGPRGRKRTWIITPKRPHPGRPGSLCVTGYGTMMAAMTKVYCDFNDFTADDLYWLLYVDDVPLSDVAEKLGLREGDRVVLFQDEGDFEVEATLHFGRTDPLFLGERLCARPDWRTLKRFG